MSGKTKKSIKKRFKLTKNKNLMRRPQHQDHFNAKETGEEKRRKRGLKKVKQQKIAKKIIKRMK
ncbi:MAG: 50S ribosomal protein L35 [Candidatus Portnoybacteria bacterium]|nr:50S ribosomal protein L35 [Candidatus Portnoybacteria bacterium]